MTRLQKKETSKIKQNYAVKKLREISTRIKSIKNVSKQIPYMEEMYKLLEILKWI